MHSSTDLPCLIKINANISIKNYLSTVSNLSPDGKFGQPSCLSCNSQRHAKRNLHYPQLNPVSKLCSILFKGPYAIYHESMKSVKCSRLQTQEAEKISKANELSGGTKTLPAPLQGPKGCEEFEFSRESQRQD